MTTSSAEAFAAMRSVTIPSQSRSSMAILKKSTGTDLVERFRELAPPRDRSGLQRWTFRRLGLTLGALLLGLVLLSLAIDNFRAGVI